MDLGIIWERFPSGYALPNVSSIARSITSGLRWLYISVTCVLECPRISEITRSGTPCTDSHEPIVQALALSDEGLEVYQTEPLN
jgi:hypothetical protein